VCFGWLFPSELKPRRLRRRLQSGRADGRGADGTSLPASSPPRGPFVP
jgi:hypothetical protein